MNNSPHAGVQLSTEPFNFRSPGAHPSLNGREAIRWRLQAAFNRHEMPGKTGEVGPPASGFPFFTSPTFALRAQGGVLLCEAPATAGNRERPSHESVRRR